MTLGCCFLITNSDEDYAVCPLAIQAWPLSRCLSNSQSTFRPCSNVSEMEIEALRFEPLPNPWFSLPLHSTSSTQSHTEAVISCNLPGVKAIFQISHLSLWTSSCISQSFVNASTQKQEWAVCPCSIVWKLDSTSHKTCHLPSSRTLFARQTCLWETAHNGSMFKLGLAGLASARL